MDGNQTKRAAACEYVFEGGNFGEIVVILELTTLWKGVKRKVKTKRKSNKKGVAWL